MPKLTFSQRKGLAPVEIPFQTDSMNETLRNSIWNVFTVLIWNGQFFLRENNPKGIGIFSASLWINFFKQPLDTRPPHHDIVMKRVREVFFELDWNGVYDFVEFVLDFCGDSIPDLPVALNKVLETENSGYRIVGGSVVDVVDTTEVEVLREEIGDVAFPGVSAHLKRALELYSDRGAPDYRNSMKEAISAVETMARIASKNDRATLGDALKLLEKTSKLHPALKDAFLKLYGYTSDQGGIRHAMMDEPNLSAAEARFFLLICTSFINLLKVRFK